MAINAEAPSAGELAEMSARVGKVRESLGAALDALEVPPSPEQVSRAAELARELHDVDREFGLLSGQEVGRLAGSRDAQGSWARERRRQGRLIAFKRKNQYVYPGYQFDVTGQVHAAIPEVIAGAREYGVSDRDLALWMTSGSASLGGRRPVDFLTELRGTERIVDALGAAFGVHW